MNGISPGRFTLLELPEELQKRIFEFVDDPTLSCVCKTFRRILQDGSLKQKTIQDVCHLLPSKNYLESRFENYSHFTMDRRIQLAYQILFHLARQRLPYCSFQRSLFIGGRKEQFKALEKDFDQVNYLVLINFVKQFPTGERAIDQILQARANASEEIKRKTLENKVKLHFTLMEEIDFPSRDLYEIPKEVTSLQKLKRFDLSNNNLSFLPDGMQQLQCLEAFLIANNRLAGFPSEVWSLPRLHTLDISGNPITFLPNTISKDSNVQVLNLSSLLIGVLPSSIACLQKLRELFVQDNYRLAEVPMEIGQLSQLRKFNLSNCPKIKELPLSIGECKELEELHLKGTSIINLPGTITKLERLQFFSFPQTLTSLPEGIQNLRNLQKVELYLSQSKTIAKLLKRLFPNIQIKYIDKQTLAGRARSFFRNS